MSKKKCSKQQSSLVVDKDPCKNKDLCKKSGLVINIRGGESFTLSNENLTIFNESNRKIKIRVSAGGLNGK